MQNWQRTPTAEPTAPQSREATLNPSAAERWRQIEALLDAALDLPPDARDDWLGSAPAELETCAEAMRLLSAHERAQRFLQRPAAEFAAALLASDGEGGSADAVPERIGPYRVLREAGHGGMGMVYLAERDDPRLRQRVALKLVRSGLEADHLVRRFLEERRILASLDHPHIARLLDGGITEDGLPWFAMEYVEGVPIDRYCVEQALGLAARLGLFLRVCDAVQHAHRKLVVHRDLKPSNILVMEPASTEPEGRVKLLDFGIAKLLAAEDGGGTAELTRAGLRPMTPGYASPEQIRGEVVSTACDVHALGVLLYTLLAGRHPYQTAGRPPHEVARAILEEEPALPSAVAADGERRRLRGDLDTIVMAAMRKEPERRYASVEQLARDIRRHLAGLPVSACHDSWRYRTGKFVHRHRAGVAAAVAFAVLLVGYGITVTVHAERVAREAQKTEQIRDFLLSLFTPADPGVTRGREPTASELVKEGARRVAAELAGQPAVQAEMMTTLGEVYLTLGRYPEASEQLEAALILRRRLHPRPHGSVARTAQLFSSALHFRGRLAEAESLLREVLGLRRQLHGERHWRVGIVLTDLGDLLHTRGELSEAEAKLRLALQILIPAQGEDHPDVARAQRDLGNVLRDRGAYAQAEPLYRQALISLETRFGPTDPQAALTRNELARLLAESGAYQESERLLQQNLSVYEVLYSQGHPVLGTTLRNLGVLRLREGRPQEAADMLRAALAHYERTLSAESSLIPRAQRHLALAMLDAGDPRAAAEIAEAAFGRLHEMGLGGHRAAADAQRVLDRARLALHRPAPPERTL
jgi:eukaryotic-like serine/threonine-protein kinase